MLNKRIDKAWALGICIAVCAAFVSIGIVQADITNPGGSSSSGGGGADGNWVYINKSGIILATTTNQVLIGGSATTSSQNLQVQGSAYVSGLVGLGTTTPSARLDINNASNVNTALYVEGGASGVTIAQFSRRSGVSTDIKITGSAGNPAFIFGANNTDKSAIGYDNANLGFAVAPGTVGTSNFLFIKDTTGNTGIGTSSPYAKLSVVGEAVARNFTATSTTATSTFSGNVLVGTETTTRFTIQQNGMVGVGTTTATSTLDVYGSFGGRVTLITSTTTIDSTYYTIRADTTSNAVGVNLPAVSGVCGRHYYIVKKNSGGGPITIDPSGSELIAGTTTQALTTQHGAIHIQAACDDSSWLILN